MVRPKVVGKAILPITVGRQPIGVRAGPVIGVALKTRFHFKHRRCLVNKILSYEGQHVKVARVLPGHHHGHVVGLGAAVDKVDALEWLRERGCQLLGVLVDLGMHVNAGSVP